MTRWKCICAYDGTDFAGWQIQAKGEITLQGTLEDRLKAIFKQHIRIHASGRTDTGVHAEAQVFHFDAEWHHSIEELLRALRSGLSQSLLITNVSAADTRFHARYSATRKHYAYYLHENYASPLDARYYWSLRSPPLDINRMRQAAQYLLGTHDFSAFGATRSTEDEKENPVKDMRRLEITRIDENKIRIDTEASGYLYKMARSLVGCLVDVGRGKLDPQKVKDILESKTRTYLVATAPAQGLRLVRVYY